MKRIYDEVIANHLKNYRQMLFLVGPRQVGKTTSGLRLEQQYQPFNYINWDIVENRWLITASREEQERRLGLTGLTEGGLVFFDEVHKYGKWKAFLKGFFDLYEKRVKIFVTGSARLAVYQRGGDSLMGRYFYYRMHPLSVAELCGATVSDIEIRPPSRLPDGEWNALLDFGGFPEPFMHAERKFWTHWKRLRRDQLFSEDLRDLSRVHDIGQIELLSELVNHQAGQLTTYTQLSKKTNVSIPTVKSWLSLLRSVYYLFAVNPWSTNVARSLLKEPKYYLWDWSLIGDDGARKENMVACHLLKAVHMWTDLGLGEYNLYFLRDKDKREVDFLVTKDRVPWFLVEVKSGNNSGINKSLYHFQEQTGAPHAFQMSFGLDYVERNCFEISRPVIVPASTFLSQLV